MKLTINRAPLLDMLQDVSRVAGSNSNKPVLDHVLIAAIGAVFSLRCTDLETEIRRTEINGVRPNADFPRIKRCGSALVNAKTLHGFLKGSKAATVTLDAEDYTLSVETSDGEKLGLVAADPDEFPLDPVGNASLSSFFDREIPASDLREGLATVLPSVGKVHRQFFLNCVALVEGPTTSDKRGVQAVASNGCQLSTFPIVEEPQEEGEKPRASQLLLPTGSVKHLVQLLPKSKPKKGPEPLVTIASNANYAHFAIGAFLEVIVRLNDAPGGADSKKEFVPFREILTAGDYLPNFARTSVGDLLRSLHLASVICDKNNVGCVLILDADSELLAVSASNHLGTTSSGCAIGDKRLDLSLQRSGYGVDRNLLEKALKGYPKDAAVTLAWGDCDKPLQLACGKGREAIMPFLQPEHPKSGDLTKEEVPQ